jgi:hypothetical protein
VSSYFNPNITLGVDQKKWLARNLRKKQLRPSSW